MATPHISNTIWHPTETAVMHVPKSTVASTDCGKGRSTATTQGQPTPKTSDIASTLATRNSLTLLSDEIIEESPKDIMDMKSREERKANGRLVAVIVAFLVIFMAVCHAWIRKTAALAGMLVPAGIMLSYGACVVILAKRDKHKRAMFVRHMEEMALQNKVEMEQKHAHKKHSHTDKDKDKDKDSPSCSTSISLQYVNELAPDGEHRKKHRRHRHRQREQEVNLAELGLAGSAKVHRSGPKRTSFRQKLFGQTIGHVKLLEMQCDSVDNNDEKSPEAQRSTAAELAERKMGTENLDPLIVREVKRLNSSP